MSAPNRMLNAVDPDGKWLHRVGGISGLIFGIAYIVIIALYVLVGTRPSGTEAWLTYLAENTMAWWAILCLSVLTDFLFIPVVLSLYLVLKGINRNAMLAAAACMGLFIILDLALTWTNIAVLITFSGDYAAATNDLHRTAIVTAAMYPSAVVGSNLLFVYNTLTLSIGILVTGRVMLKGIFNKPTAYVGLVTGILGIVSVAGPVFVNALSVTIIIASLLTTAWILLVGYRLMRLSQQ